MVWTVIPDSDIDPDSPITTGLMTAYRDNFAAMAAGDSGAPQIINLKPSSALNDNITTDGSQSIGATSRWTPPQGFHNIISLSNTGDRLELYVSGAWRVGANPAASTILTDGVNMRLYNASAVAVATYWQRFDG